MFKFLNDSEYLDFHEVKIFECEGGELIKEGDYSLFQELFGYKFETFRYKKSKKEFLEELNELFHSSPVEESFVLSLRSLFEDNFNVILYSWEPLILTKNRIKFILYSDDYEIFLFFDIKEKL